MNDAAFVAAAEPVAISTELPREILRFCVLIRRQIFVFSPIMSATGGRLGGLGLCRYAPARS
ncbi:hypothetical protein [Rhizobium sp. WW_1]|jgi:hypothetical protein|uniref:hypothetical protein n=1 Tax=Rhizobium sp. WW_1 TaxID=1907375 RepID=UPI0011C43891|nr:hypothetical protein [Rhizobium sp. WW_1]